MHYKTINLKPATYEKLLKYKNSGESFDDVINSMLEEIDSVELYEDVLDEHKSIVKEMEKGEYATLDEVKKKLKLK